MVDFQASTAPLGTSWNRVFNAWFRVSDTPDLRRTDDGWLGFFPAALTEFKDFDQRLRQIKGTPELSGQPLELDKIAPDSPHRLRAGADEAVTRVEVVSPRNTGA